MKKIFWSFVAIFFASAVVSVAYTGIKIERFQRQTQSRMVPQSTGLSNNPRALSTAEILDSVSLPGRAFLDFNTSRLFTNFHVLEPICQIMRGRLCEGNEIRVKLLADRERVHTRLVKRSFCIRWLDVCVIDSVGWNSFGPTEDIKWPPLNEPQIFALARTDDNGAVNILSGKVLHKKRVISILEIPTRKGSSGSPVFDKDGLILGIATTNAQDLDFINYLTFRAFWSKKYGLYSPITIVTNYSVLKKAASCLEKDDIDCTATEQDLLVDLALDYADIGNSAELSFEEKIRFRRFLKPEALAEIQKLGQALEQKKVCELTDHERTVNIAVKFMGHLSQNLPSRENLSDSLLEIAKCGNPVSNGSLIDKLLIYTSHRN